MIEDAGFMLVIFSAIIIYMIPTIIAFIVDHKNVAAITIINIFLGWTFLGWVITLAWSVTGGGRDD